MAVLTNPVIAASGGTSDGSLKWAVIAFKNVTAGDTFDMAALTSLPFVKVIAAMFVPSTNRTATMTVAGIAGTVITMAGVGIAGDSGYLFVVGE